MGDVIIFKKIKQRRTHIYVLRNLALKTSLYAYFRNILNMAPTISVF